LDVSGHIDCSKNHFSGSSLNALFETLHDNHGLKAIHIGGNPGTGDCDRSIATAKGWEVVD